MLQQSKIAQPMNFSVEWWAVSFKLGLCALVEAKRFGTKSRKPASEKRVEEDCMSVFFPQYLDLEAALRNLNFGLLRLSSNLGSTLREIYCGLDIYASREGMQDQEPKEEETRVVRCQWVIGSRDGPSFDRR